MQTRRAILGGMAAGGVLAISGGEALGSVSRGGKGVTITGCEIISPDTPGARQRLIDCLLSTVEREISQWHNPAKDAWAFDGKGTFKDYLMALNRRLLEERPDLFDLWENFVGFNTHNGYDIEPRTGRIRPDAETRSIGGELRLDNLHGGFEHDYAAICDWTEKTKVDLSRQGMTMLWRLPVASLRTGIDPETFDPMVVYRARYGAAPSVPRWDQAAA